MFCVTSERHLLLQRCEEQPLPSCLEGKLGHFEESANCQTNCRLIDLHKH